MNFEPTHLPLADLHHVLDHTHDWWSPLRGEAVLLTGGTGTVGRWLLESFLHVNRALDLQAQAVVMTRSPEQFTARLPQLATHPAVHLVQGDVRHFDPADLAAASGGSGRIPFVIHAATASHSRFANGASFRVLDTLYTGTRRVLEWAVSQSATRVLLVSSSGVYQTPPDQMLPIAESFAGAPDCQSGANALAEGKRVMELLGTVFREQHGLDCKTARCFPCLGPGVPLQSGEAAGNYLHAALTGAAVLLPEDASQRGSYLYVADLAVWLWTMLLRESASPVFNVGSDEACTLRTLAERVVGLGTAPVPLVETGAAAADAAASNPVPNVGRARQELGLAVHVDLETSLRRTFRYYEPLYHQLPVSVSAG